MEGKLDLFNPRHHKQWGTNLQDTLSYLFTRYLFSASSRGSMQEL